MSGGAGKALRSFHRDPGAASQKLAPGTFTRILAFARPYRRALVCFLLLVVAEALVSVSLPLLLKAIIDDGIGRNPPVTGRPHLVVVLACVTAALAVVSAAISLGNRWFSARIGEGLIYDMRSQVYTHLQRQPIAFFTRTQTGALVSRLNNDVLGAQQAFTGTLGSVFANGVGVTLTLIAMLALSWQITLVSLVLLPVFILPAKRLGGRLSAITREGYGLSAEMSTMMTERFNVSGALLVKLFGRPAEEEAQFRARAGRVRDIGVTSAMYGRVFFAALTLVASLAVAIVYGVGGTLAARGSLPVGTVVALAAYLTRLYGPLTALSNVRVEVMTALVSFERVLEVLDLDPAIADLPGAPDLPAGPARVEFCDVTFRYPSADEVSLASLEAVATLDTSVPTDVLHAVSFTIEPGQMTALVGPSGSGKTTLSQLLTRMYDPQSGSVRINGHDLREVTLASIRDTVGVVSQDAHVFHDTIAEALRYARPEASDAEIWAALDAAQVGGLVRSLPDGLDTMVGDRGYRLSGGERQRLAIARLLLRSPSVVVLDEATAHLDSESEAAVQAALAEVLAGRTSLVIAHRLSTIVNADQILVVDDGRIVQRGTHAELLGAEGLYRELYRTQWALA